MLDLANLSALRQDPAQGRVFETDLTSTTASRNFLLAALPPDDLALVLPHLSRIRLNAGDRIAASASPVVRVCFPETLVASVGEVMADGTRFEIGMIGREGMIGWPALLGSAHSPHCGIAQLGGGTAFVMPASTLVGLCERSPDLHAALLRFIQSFTVQMGHTIVTNLRDGIDRRLARWLLMLHDRIDGDVLPVTHGELASALHVRRASVTDWLHILEGDRVLRCTRGQVAVRDRDALAAVAGESYGAAETSYRRLIGAFGKSR